MRSGVQRWLAGRPGQLSIIGVALVLVAPSLTTGLVADDHIQQLLMRKQPGIDGLARRSLDLFSFATGNPDSTHRLMNAGVFPWWTDPRVRLAFFRPLSALTHLFDHWLWPTSTLLMHAQNLLWFGLALLAVGAFYRRFLGATWVAGLALLLYAVDDAHGPAVGWVANRNAMVALALALPAVIFHDRWRRDRWRPGAWLGPLVLALGLLAGESALAVTAYLAAYALKLDPGRPRARFYALLPYAGVVAIWRISYHALGYGAFGSGVYLDPASDLGAFLRALPQRLLWLLDGQFALLWSDLSSLYRFISPHAETVMIEVALVLLALVVAAFVPLCRRDRTARFFATGLILAALPSCATFAADRLLWFIGLGAMGLIAQLIATERYTVVERIAVPAFIALHLVLSPPLLALRSRSMDTVERALARANDSLPKTAAITRQTVVLVNPPADIFAGYLLFTRVDLGEPRPERIRWLATGGAGVELTRVDERTLRVRPLDGFLKNLTEQMLRSPRRPLALGSRVVLDGMTVEITRLTADGRPAEALFQFGVPLEDPSLYWAQWKTAGYVPFTPPPVGTRVTLPPIDFLTALFPKS